MPALKLLKKGDTILLTQEHTVYTKIPESQAYTNSKSKRLVSVCVELKDEEFEHLQGLYEVVRTENSGGGRGHGKHDTYPSGHRVFCKKVDSNCKVDFYQTGCFTAMITDIKPIKGNKDG
ncbi:hypothetical protein [Vibrio sp. D431a]|uniref:hypothetical protein n=1 Tax=Vibrio sp. D431a TaxID=2837388 RepID=UPI0025531FAD|nr:hypothetical protein [Vibrio sp. D431a]MDK9793706.1 hypothetical protein [Vibrio sp. D431a]